MLMMHQALAKVLLIGAVFATTLASPHYYHLRGGKRNGVATDTAARRQVSSIGEPLLNNRPLHDAETGGGQGGGGDEKTTGSFKIDDPVVKGAAVYEISKNGQVDIDLKLRIQPVSGGQPGGPGAEKKPEGAGEKPGSPGGEKPVAPGSEKPGGPGSEKPGGPGSEKPGEPGSEKPGGPESEKPGGPGSEKPGGPGSEKPGGPESEKPGGPGSEKPGGPGSEKPGGPGSEKPGGQTGEQPGKPGSPGDATTTAAPGGASPTTPSSGGGGGGSDDEKTALNKHNEYRKRHGTPAMTLDAEMSKSAAAYAKKLADSGGSLTHSSRQERDNAGENLAYGCESSKAQTAEEAVTNWYNEVCKPGYTFGGKESGGSGTGHFTQVVWKGSTKLGFGGSTFDKDGMKCALYVGRYKEAGNMGGEYDTNVPKGDFNEAEHCKSAA